jgi:hypothetical protein
VPDAAVTSVPKPGTLLLGLGTVAWIARRRKKI